MRCTDVKPIRTTAAPSAAMESPPERCERERAPPCVPLAANKELRKAFISQTDFRASSAC